MDRDHGCEDNINERDVFGGDKRKRLREEEK